jgi:hypothetical protein
LKSVLTAKEQIYKKHPFPAVLTAGNSLNLKLALATFFRYSGVIKTMGLKPYSTYFLNPLLKPGAMDKK